MRRFLSVVLASVYMAACGGGGDGGSTTPPAPTPAAVASVSVSLNPTSVLPGRSSVASVELRSAAGDVLTGRAVSWSSANTAVATVDGSGNVTAVTTGSSTITATSEGRSGSATITVLPAPVATVSVTLASASVVAGTATSATAAPRDDRGNALTGRTVTWTSSVPSVATVDGSGVITTLTPGVTNIVATSEGQSGTATLTVIPRVTGVTISGSTRVKVGDSYSYSLTMRISDGTIVSRPATWSVSDPTRASITQSGVLTAQNIGSFRIQVTIDGSLWDALYTAYDWQSFTSGGTLFTTIEADNTIIGRRGIAEYPSLVFSCNTSGNFFTWVSFTNFITSSGAVAMSFDDAPPFSATWDELSPNYSTLWKPGSNATVKAFALQIASARQFGFAFTEYLGTAKAMIFRVTGLSPRLAPIIAACPGSAIVANADQAQVVAGSLTSAQASANAVATATQIERRLRATSAPSMSVGPTIQALAAVRATEVQSAIRRR